jgi:hypothetical protein
VSGPGRHRWPDNDDDDHSARLYTRRRIDQLTDRRLVDIETDVGNVNTRLTRLESRINYLFGGLAVLVAVLNLISPFLAEIGRAIAHALGAR